MSDFPSWHDASLSQKKRSCDNLEKSELENHLRTISPTWQKNRFFITPYPPASTLFRHTTHKTLVMSSNIERSRVQDTVFHSDDDEDSSALSSPSSREQISEAKTAYLLSENSKKQLYLLCVGIKDDDGAAIFDLEMQPWKSLKKKDVKPSRGEYAKEVIRRSEGLSDKSKTPKTAYWSATKCIEWLQCNPIHNDADILFLKDEVSRL